MRNIRLLLAVTVVTSMALLTSCSGNSGSVDEVVALGPDTQVGIRGLIENHDGLSNDAEVVLFDDGSAIVVWYGSETTQDPPRVFASRFVPGGDWSVPQAIDDGSGDPYPPRLVANQNGDAVAIWAVLDANGVDQQIYANVYLAGVGWGSAQPLQTPGMQQHPQVALNDAGNALAVWREMDAAGGKSIVSSRFAVATQMFPGPVTLSTAGTLSVP